MPLRALVAERGHDLPQLMYAWVWAGVLAARAGAPMPPRSPRTPPSDGDAPPDYPRWIQPADEAAEWSDILRNAGSSMRSVVLLSAECYVAVGGDVMAMRCEWNRRMGLSDLA